MGFLNDFIAASADPAWARTQNALDRQAQYGAAVQQAYNQAYTRHQAPQVANDGVAPAPSNQAQNVAELANPEMLMIDSMMNSGNAEAQKQALSMLQQRQQRKPAAMPTFMQEYQFARSQGYGGSYMDFVQDKKQAPININTGKQPGRLLAQAEVQAMGLPNGSYWMDPVTGPKKISGYTDAQTKEAQFANRMLAAEANAERALQEGGLDPASLRENVGVIAPDWLANFVRTPGGKLYNQAQVEWVRAKLRDESGAVIGVEEAIDEASTYFPRPGDTDEVMRQKAKRRAEVARDMVASSQGAYEQLFGEVPAFGAEESAVASEPGEEWDTSIGPRPGVKWVD